MGGPKYTASEIEILRGLGTQYTYEDIARLLPYRPLGSIKVTCCKMGIKKGYRKYTYHKNYFSKLTPESCYWAGFLAADAYISKQKNTISLDLHEREISITYPNLHQC
jgi:hypothetical protein